MDIHPARENEEDYPSVTSDIILKDIINGEHINIDEAYKFKDTKNSVIIFMSPNDISSLKDSVINVLKEEDGD